MLYMIGLGLDKKGISLRGLEAVKKCKKVYLENYTVNFPYSVQELEEVIGRKVIGADRSLVEGESLIKEAKKEDICLLVYGSPLTATTHISLIEETKKNKVKCEIIHNASILDAVAETGLQLYKFGKITSMPKWQKNFTPDSFMEIVEENVSIGTHSLILIDIGLDLKDAVKELEESAKNHKIKLDKIVLCSNMGNNSKIVYKEIKKLKSADIKKPYCMIIPGKLHFVEEEVLKGFE